MGITLTHYSTQKTETEREKTMTLEQMIKKKEACEERIRKDTEEKEQLELQIKKQAGDEVMEHLEKIHISIADFMKIRQGNKEQLQALLNSLGKEEHENKDDKKERNDGTKM